MGPPVWPWPPLSLVRLTQGMLLPHLPSLMPTLTGQEYPLLTHSPPALAAVVILASVALMLTLSQDTLLMVMDFVLMLMVSQDTLLMASILMLMELVLAFLTTELFTESASFTLLDTPTRVLSVASVVLMLMLMLIMDIPMDMLVVDTMDMVDMAMAVDTTGVNRNKLFFT